MDVVDTTTQQWLGPLDHRGGGIQFKPLFTGEEGQPDNYVLTLVQVMDRYHAPPHRHNFDQVRYLLKGEFGFGSKVQCAGQVGYFPEGTEYAQSAEGYSLTLLLQASNASRARYVSREELKRAAVEMKNYGQFEGGEFITSSSEGESVRDGYEASWEHITGEKIAYSEPRYTQPVIMEPERFEFVPHPSLEGVFRKPMGTFSERELAIGFFKIAADAELPLDGAVIGKTLFYVIEGDGEADGRPYEPGFGARLDVEDKGLFKARTQTILLYLAMPK